MQLTKHYITNYLDCFMKCSTYAQKVKEKNKLECLKTITLADLDYIEGLKNLLKQIKADYPSLPSNINWKATETQKYMPQQLKERIEDIKHNEQLKSKNNQYLLTFEDFYWNTWDYFYYSDYHGQITKEEFNPIIPIIDEFLSQYDKLNPSSNQNINKNDKFCLLVTKSHSTQIRIFNNIDNLANKINIKGVDYKLTPSQFKSIKQLIDKNLTNIINASKTQTPQYLNENGIDGFCKNMFVLSGQEFIYIDFAIADKEIKELGTNLISQLETIITG